MTKSSGMVRFGLPSDPEGGFWKAEGALAVSRSQALMDEALQIQRCDCIDLHFFCISCNGGSRQVAKPRA